MGRVVYGPLFLVKVIKDIKEASRGTPDSLEMKWLTFMQKRQ
jgi:hypothetical protein